MNNEAIVNSIKALCKNENISASQLEKEVGLSQGLISKWQKTTPSLDKIIDIADYFHKSVDEVIGRKANFDDEFLEMIYSKTLDKTMIWCTNSIVDDNRIVLPHRDYDEDIYTEISYMCKFNQGSFIVNCFSEYHKTTNPIELDFYIKPDDKSELVNQNYNTNQLKPLWIAIINNLAKGAPDEIKVENLKQQFLTNDFTVFDKVKNTSYLVEVKERNKYLRELHKVFKSPQFNSVYETITQDDFIKQLEELIHNINDDE